jgi:mono/diheme cytochrome c family protein
MMTMSSKIRRQAGAVLLGTVALAPPAWAESRGELLYSTHCIACHTTQKHWRDNRVATDWNSLKALVRRWQAEALLGWSEEDILAVTRHLNESFYRFSGPAGQLGLRWPPAAARHPATAGYRPSGQG